MEKRERRGRVRREASLSVKIVQDCSRKVRGLEQTEREKGRGRGERKRDCRKKGVRRKKTIFPKRRGGGGRRARKLDERIPTNRVRPKRLEFTEFILSVVFLQRERDAEGPPRAIVSRGEI